MDKDFDYNKLRANVGAPPVKNNILANFQNHPRRRES